MIQNVVTTHCVLSSLNFFYRIASRFQHNLFLIITTLLTWLKSTLLLKIKCFVTTIYMKIQCLQTNETQHYCRKENAWEVGRRRERVALIKSLIMRDRKDVLEARLQKIDLKMSADKGSQNIVQRILKRCAD